MRLLATICMPALMLGAAAFVTPALAQADAGANAAAAGPAQPAQDANSAAVPAQSAEGGATTSDQAAMNSQPSSSPKPASPSGNSQMAMNSSGNANDLSSVPDNQHKYNRAHRAKDNQSEDQTTKQLNQQEASLNGGSSAGASAQ